MECCIVAVEPITRGNLTAHYVRLSVVALSHLSLQTVTVLWRTYISQTR